MKDRDIERVGVIGVRMKHAGRWWTCIGGDTEHYVTKTGRFVAEPRRYLLTRPGEGVRVTAAEIEAVERTTAAGDRTYE